MSDQQDILRLLLNEPVRAQEPQIVESSFEKARSVVGDYSRLVTGQGYTFRAFPSSVEAVGKRKKPLIPMLVSIVPPENFPTGEGFTTKQVSVPFEQEIELTAFRERISSPRTGISRTVERIVPSDPSQGERLAEIDQRLQELQRPGSSVAERDELLLERDAILGQARFIEVDVPVRTPQGAEAQTQRTEEYLRDLRSRYLNFSKDSKQAEKQIALNEPITAGTRKTTRDPLAANPSVQKARTRKVQDDVDFLRSQALQMLDLPPLFMYINPESFGKSYDFIVSDGNRTRDGYMVEFWGEQLPKITASGSVGAFYIDAKDRFGNPAGGLAVNARKGSFAYQQFLSLFQAYRNNGYIFNSDSRISLVGSIALFYDGVIYTGSFDSFVITHSSDQPFSLRYTFSFTVRYEQKVETI
jgi:hypothetical protein